MLAGPLALWAGAAWAAGMRLTAGPESRGGFGYNGASPGPLLRGRVGAPMTLTLVNVLAEPTSLRLPGLAGLDDAPILPGDAREFRLTPSEPGFDCYGPFGAGAKLWDAGLFGAIVIDEAAPPAVDLDAVAVFSGDATDLRINGERASLQLFARPGARVRLRLANATPDLMLNMRSGGAASVIAAIDGQPCPPFSPREGELPLCPAGRFELMFDLVAAFELTVAGERPALRISPRGGATAPRPALAPLPANPRLPDAIALERAKQVRIVVENAGEAGFALNGAAGAPGKPLFQIARGTPVALTLVNDTGTAQTLRLGGHVARILHALDDGWDPYWRDALFIPAGRKLHVAFVADAPGRWPLASASAEKRAKGMAGWYVVA